MPCPSPDGCDYSAGACKPFGRLNVRIGDEDELGSFVFRTTGFNSIRTLATRLRYFHAVSGGRLSTMPLELRLRGKSTTLSHRAPIYYVDLTVRSGGRLTDCIATALSEWDLRDIAGFRQEKLDEAAKTGLAFGAFEESIDEGPGIVEEFYPMGEANPSPGPTAPLAEKLQRRLGVSRSVGNADNGDGSTDPETSPLG
jgi:hypothetical protein